MNHNNIRQLVSAYYDGQLSDEDNAFVERHLKECESCRRYLHSLESISNYLKTWEDEDLSPDFEQKINRGLFLEAKKKGGEMKKHFSLSAVTCGIWIVVIIGLIAIYRYIRPPFLSTHTDIAMSVGSIPQSQRLLSYRGVSDKLNQVGAVAMLKTRKEAIMVAPSKAVVEINELSAPGRYMLAKESLARPLTDASIEGYPTTRAAIGGGMPELWLDEEDVLPVNNRYNPNFNTEEYDRIYENEFLAVKENPLSTFSIDVDTASYSNIRRFLNNNRMPPKDAVRIEEMINYFTYDYPNPTGDRPFSITIKAAKCPWNNAHDILLIGLHGKTPDTKGLPPSNLVFLIDVSGSMNQPNKLPLLKTAFRMLVNQLSDNERVAIVVYAGAAGKVLDSTPGSDKQKILDAIDNLRAGGSTAGGAGIKLAYKIAQENFIKGGNNRVILATDGDFNVGASSDAELIRLIEENRKKGIFLTVLGFGTGNYKDAKMEKLADKGDGNYYYIDTLKEAKKVLVHELGSTLFTIAKDVKIQIEFNPAKVKAYRLIGYENRILAKEDFNDDTKDAGELGAGHTVTALYELVPADSEENFRQVDDLIYQKQEIKQSDDLLTVKLRYKLPDSNKSKLIKKSIKASNISESPQGDFLFASSVAEFGLLLRGSKFKGNATYDDVLKNAKASKGKDRYGYRQEFIELVEKAKMLDFSSPDGKIQFK